MWIITAFLITALQLPSPSTGRNPESKQCAVDPDILSLSYEQFDHDPVKSWRKLAATEECKPRAVRVLDAYRSRMLAHVSTLYWHQGQLEAMQEHRDIAIDLMNKSRVAEINDSFGWNLYVDATIAFLRNDQISLKRSYTQLEALERPSDWPESSEWPQNGSVVKSLNTCFGKSYREAYSKTCRR